MTYFYNIPLVFFIVLSFSALKAQPVPGDMEQVPDTARNSIYQCEQPVIKGITACDPDAFQLSAQSEAEQIWWWVKDGDEWTYTGEGKNMSIPNFGDDREIRVQAQCPYNPQQNKRLSTFYNGDNGKEGMMFRLVASKKIVLNGFDVNMFDGEDFFSVFVHNGPYRYDINQPEAWTLHEQQYIHGKGKNKATYVDIEPITMQAGDTLGIYMSFENNGIMYYDNGKMDVSDDNIKLDFGKGVSWAFTSVCADRVFNGSVHYSLGEKPVSEAVYTEAVSIEAPERPGIRFNGTYFTTNTEHDVQWFLDGKSIDGGNSTVLYPRDPGRYSVVVSEKGCPSEPSLGLYYEHSDFNDYTDLSKLNLYPNPVKDVAYLHFEREPGRNVKFSVHDASGKMVETGVIKPESGLRHSLDMHQLEPGVYNIRLSSKEQVNVITFVKS
jgi:hypothetical protein